MVRGWGFERRFLSQKINLILVIVMQMKAIYGGEVLKPLMKLDLREEGGILIEVKRHRLSIQQDFTPPESSVEFQGCFGMNTIRIVSGENADR